MEQDGIERKLKKTAWAALTKGQRSIAACATENKCAPDEAGLKLEESALDDVDVAVYPTQGVRSGAGRQAKLRRARSPYE